MKIPLADRWSGGCDDCQVFCVNEKEGVTEVVGVMVFGIGEVFAVGWGWGRVEVGCG